MIFRRDEDMAPVQQGIDSTRLWVSDEQWLSILERVERGQQLDLPGEDCRRLHVREAFTCRCLLRMGSDAGTYIVRTRDISAGGIRFVHGQYLRPGTRCTVALQPDGRLGRIVSAVVAWCNEIEYYDEDIEGYEVGVKFDEPLDITRFVGAA